MTFRNVRPAKDLIGFLCLDGPREAGSVGWMVDTNRYFIDLHTVAGLITLTWPAARNLALSAEHVEILEQDALEREERRDGLRGGAGKFHHFHALASPSVDAKAYVCWRQGLRRGNRHRPPPARRRSPTTGPHRSGGPRTRVVRRATVPLPVPTYRPRSLVTQAPPGPGSTGSRRQTPDHGGPQPRLKIDSSAGALRFSPPGTATDRRRRELHAFAAGPSGTPSPTTSPPDHRGSVPQPVHEPATTRLLRPPERPSKLGRDWEPNRPAAV